jgi:hypothetical protein
VLFVRRYTDSDYPLEYSNFISIAGHILVLIFYRRSHPDNTVLGFLVQYLNHHDSSSGKGNNRKTIVSIRKDLIDKMYCA